LIANEMKMLIVRHAFKLKAHAVEMAALGVVKMDMEMEMRLP